MGYRLITFFENWTRGISYLKCKWLIQFGITYCVLFVVINISITSTVLVQPWICEVLFSPIETWNWFTQSHLHILQFCNIILYILLESAQFWIRRQVRGQKRAKIKRGRKFPRIQYIIMTLQYLRLCFHQRGDRNHHQKTRWRNLS